MEDYFNQLEDSALYESEGQLSVDVIETEREIIVRSAIAGVKTEDLDISVTADTVTIRGERDHGCVVEQTDVTHVQECYWGTFSRSVVLPHHVRPDDADAALKNGILTIRLKKAEMTAQVPVSDA